MKSIIKSKHRSGYWVLGIIGSVLMLGLPVSGIIAIMMADNWPAPVVYTLLTVVIAWRYFRDMIYKNHRSIEVTDEGIRVQLLFTKEETFVPFTDIKKVKVNLTSDSDGDGGTNSLLEIILHDENVLAIGESEYENYDALKYHIYHTWNEQLS
ncbi:MAG: hypothetical protein V4590_11820 [Bacteroidota bacterium]